MSIKIGERERPKTADYDRLWKFLIMTGVLIGVGVLVLGGYMELVKAGSVPAPSLAGLQDMAQGLGILGGSALMAIFWLAVAIIVFCAAIAPLIFAIRSGDILTVLISIVLVVVTWTAAIYSRTVIDMAVASIIYLASMVLSVAVFGTAKITTTIRRSVDHLGLPSIR